MYSNHVLRNQVVDFWTLPCYCTHRSAAIWSWSAKLIKVNLSTSSVATQTKIIKHPNKHFLPPQSYYNDKPNRKQPHLWRPCRTILPLLKTSQFSTKSWSPTTRLLLSFVSDLPFLPKCCISFLWLVKCCKIISPYNTKKNCSRYTIFRGRRRGRDAAKRNQTSFWDRNSIGRSLLWMDTHV